VRRDRLSDLVKLKQPSAFPSVMASYRVISRDDATTLAVRGGWGISGGMGSFGTSPLLVQVSQPFPAELYTDRYTERRLQSELGVDLSTVRNRLALSATTFAARNQNLYMRSLQATVVGFNEVLMPDLVDASVAGFELAARMVALDLRQLRWTAELVGVRTNSKLKRPVFENAFAYSNREYPVGRSHLLMTNEPLTRIASYNQIVPGNAAPRFDASFTNRIASGPLSLLVQLDWRSGGDVYSSAREIQDLFKTSPDFDAPSPDGVGNLGTYRSRNRPYRQDSLPLYMQSGSAVRIREAVLRYALPLSLARRVMGAGSLGVSVQARNLALWSDSFAPDPEFSGLGTSTVARYVDLARYPPMRQIFFGVDLGF
jgi:TonB-dependent starch-binding outer membrane protein SusC